MAFRTQNDMKPPDCTDPMGILPCHKQTVPQIEEAQPLPAVGAKYCTSGTGQKSAPRKKMMIRSRSARSGRPRSSCTFQSTRTCQRLQSNSRGLAKLHAALFRRALLTWTRWFHPDTCQRHITGKMTSRAPGIFQCYIHSDLQEDCISHKLMNPLRRSRTLHLLSHHWHRQRPLDPRVYNPQIRRRHYPSSNFGR